MARLGRQELQCCPEGYNLLILRRDGTVLADCRQHHASSPIEAYPEHANLYRLTPHPYPQTLFVVREPVSGGRAHEIVLFEEADGASPAEPRVGQV